MTKRSEKPARARGRVPQAEIDAACSLLREGVPIRLVAQRVGISADTIHRWLRPETDNETGRAIREARADGIIELHRQARERDGGGARWLLTRSGVGGPDGYGDRAEVVTVDAGQDHGAFWRDIAAQAVRQTGDDDGDEG